MNAFTNWLSGGKKGRTSSKVLHQLGLSLVYRFCFQDKLNELRWRMAGLAVSESSPFMTVSQLRWRQLADSCILCVGSTGSGKGGDIELLLVLVALHYIICTLSSFST